MAATWVIFPSKDASLVAVPLRQKYAAPEVQGVKRFVIEMIGPSGYQYQPQVPPAPFPMTSPASFIAMGRQGPSTSSDPFHHSTPWYVRDESSLTPTIAPLLLMSTAKAVAQLLTGSSGQGTSASRPRSRVWPPSQIIA